MPNLLSVQDSIRASGYDFSGFLNTPPREVVLSGTVTAAPGEPTFTLAYTCTGGSHTDVRPHMEVEVFSSTGASKGRLRVALGPVTSSLLPINETSRGRMKVVAGDTFVVMREWRVRDLLVGATLTFPKDSRVAYTNQNALVTPLPLTGGHWAGPVDDGAAYATVPFFGSLSRVMDADSSGAKTYLWDVKDGTIVTGTNTDADIVVQFPPGKRWIDFTVTDASNGASATQRVCVIVEDAEHPPLPCSIDDLSGTRADGWRVTFQLPLRAYSAISELPDGQMILYHEDEWRAGAKASYGSPIDGRSRIKFVGFLVRETVDIDPERGVVTFEALSPLAVLTLLPGFSQALLDRTSANWQTYPSLTVLRAIVYLIAWHTTLPTLFDLDLSRALDRPFPELYIQQNTPYLQVMELVEGLSSEFVCDRAGRFYVQRKLARSTAAVRDAADTLLRLSASDIVSLRVTREHRYKSAQMEGKGFTQGANGKPVLAVAPGEAPAEAPDFTSTAALIVTDQEELNVLTGWAYAEENSLYDGQPMPLALEIRLRGGYDVGDFTSQWVLLDLPPEVDPRGVGYDDARLQLDAVQVSYGDGGKEVVWTCSHETIGEKGTMRQVPVDPLPDVAVDFNLDFSIPYPSVARDPMDIVEQYPVALVCFLASGTAQALYGTLFNPATGAVNWTLHNTNLTGDLIAVKADPHDYRRWFAITTTGLWCCDNFPANSGWYQVANNAALTGDAGVPAYHIDMSLARRGYIGITYGRNGVLRSFDYGASFAASTMDGAAVQLLGAHDALSCHMCVSQQDNGVIWGGHVSTDPYSIVYLRVSTDSGATWTNKATLTGWNTARSAPVLNVPYMRTPGVPNKAGASQWVYYNHGRIWGGEPSRVGMTQNGGTTWSALPRATFDPEFIGAPSKYGLHTYTQDGQIVTYWRTNGNYRQLYASTDALATNNIINGSIFDAFFTATRMGINGWPSNPYFLIIFSSGGVYFTPDYRTDTYYSLLTGLTNANVLYCAGDLSFISA